MQTGSGLTDRSPAARLSPPQISIVIPCYNEEEVLPETVRRLGALLDEMRAAQIIGEGSGIVLVDDGSKDRTWELISHFASQDSRINGLRLSRNRGHQNALLAGLHAARGDAVISVDADLQDDLGIIPDMIARFSRGCDIVYGVRGDRASDSFLKRFTAESYYRVLAVLGVNVVFNHADYRLMSRRALEALRDFTEVNLFLRGVIPLLGFRSETVAYSRRERFAGESKYPLSKMLALAINGVTAFSATPLRMITAIGFSVSFISIAIAAWALWVRLATQDTVPGWTSTVVPLLLVSGVQLLALGVIGEYVAKTYLETKRRPQYFIDEVVGPLAEPQQPVAAQGPMPGSALTSPERDELFRLRAEVRRLRSERADQVSEA